MFKKSKTDLLSRLHLQTLLCPLGKLRYRRHPTRFFDTPVQLLYNLVKQPLMSVYRSNDITGDAYIKNIITGQRKSISLSLELSNYQSTSSIFPRVMESWRSDLDV